MFTEETYHDCSIGCFKQYDKTDYFRNIGKVTLSLLGDGKDNSGGDLDEDSGKSFRKQRKFILEGDDDSVLSGAESSEDYSDEESPSRRGTPSSRESSARIRKVGEGGRTASAIAKAYGKA